MIDIRRKDLKRGGKYAKLFAMVRALLMGAHEHKMIEIEDYMLVDSGIVELEAFLLTVAREANA